MEETTAVSLEAVLDTGGADAALGLVFERKFEDGKIGFPGTFRSSSGALVPVRVLSGIPDCLWTARMNAPVAPTVVPQPVLTRVQDRPRLEKKFSCKLNSCSKTFVHAGRCNKHMSTTHPNFALVPYVTGQQVRAGQENQRPVQPRMQRGARRKASSDEEDDESDKKSSEESCEESSEASDEESDEENDEDCGGDRLDGREGHGSLSALRQPSL